MDSEQAAAQRKSGKKYNIVTVVTFDYFPFFIIFLNSLFRNVRCENLETLYVVVDQLPEEFVRYLSSFEKVKVLQDSTRLNFTEIYSESWRQAVLRRLAGCQVVLQLSDLPLLLLDSDSLFVNDISDFFESTHDLLVTLITDPEERRVPEGRIPVNYTASAVIFNRRTPSLEFIDRWLVTAENVSRNFAPPHETPALNLLLETELQSNKLTIGVLKDHHVSANQNQYQGTSIIHLKSGGPPVLGPVENFMARISLREWPAFATPANYLDAYCYERWLLYQRGYLQLSHLSSTRVN